MDGQDEDLGSFSSFEDGSETSASSNSISSSSSDFNDDATFIGNPEEEVSLFEMSDLISQLPIKEQNPRSRTAAFGWPSASNLAIETSDGTPFQRRLGTKPFPFVLCTALVQETNVFPNEA